VISYSPPWTWRDHFAITPESCIKIKSMRYFNVKAPNAIAGREPMAIQIHEVVQQIRSAALSQDETALTDGQLLIRFLEERDQAAVATLVRRHGSMVWGVCRRILDRHHDAEDAFQATFLVLIRKASSVRKKEAVGNWLYGVAHQTALRARAMLAKRRVRERQETLMPEQPNSESHAGRELQAVLDQELSRLPEKYRTAIVLCDLEGRTRMEAARQLRCPEGTVAARLARARKMLAGRLTRRGVLVSSGVLAAALTHNAAHGLVPASVIANTIKALTTVLVGQAAATGAISVKVAALAEGVLKAMFLNKLLKITVVLLVGLGVAAFGGGLAMHHANAAQDKTANSKDSTSVPAQQDKAKQEPKESKPAAPTPAPADPTLQSGEPRDLKDLAALAEKQVAIKRAGVKVAEAQVKIAEAKLKGLKAKIVAAEATIGAAKKRLDRDKNAGPVVGAGVLEEDEAAYRIAVAALEDAQSGVQVGEGQVMLEAARRDVAIAELEEAELRLNQIRERLK
jgi:RNA polymerase sigma factor (sigma-70 family)